MANKSYSVCFAVLAAIALIACSNQSGTSYATARRERVLVYFGFDDHSEKQADALKLAETWGEGKNRVCGHWHTTISEKDADYKILFGIADITVLGKRGEILYHGGPGPLYLPHGNPDGSGTNICKLTGE